MDKLPKVYANPIDKDLDNVQNTFKNDLAERQVINPQNINKKINEIFALPSHVFKSKVKITFKDHESNYEIVGKTNLNLLTIDGQLIKITDIVDIQKI